MIEFKLITPDGSYQTEYYTTGEWKIFADPDTGPGIIAMINTLYEFVLEDMRKIDYIPNHGLYVMNQMNIWLKDYEMELVQVTPLTDIISDDLIY